MADLYLPPLGYRAFIFAALFGLLRRATAISPLLPEEGRLKAGVVGGQSCLDGRGKFRHSKPPVNDKKKAQ